MKRASLVVSALAALSLSLAPGLADARAGGGSSMGSRGSMTWSAPPATRTAPYSAQPMQRSMTPNNPSSGFNGNTFGSPAYQPRSGFMSGLMGGLIGAGIGGLLLGHGFFGGGLGFFGFIGFLLQILLLVFIVRWLFRLFRGSSPALAGGPASFFRGGPSGPGPMPMGGGGPRGVQPINIAPGDYQVFEELLTSIEAAWSAQDLNALRAMATPEMVNYFAEQLSDYASRGLRNEVRDVRLLQGDLSQAWAEHGREYATVAMRYSLIDVTRDSTGRVVDGSPAEHQTVTELWTFVRSASRGPWILSAIQQTR